MTIRQATIEDSLSIFEVADAAFSPSPWPISVFQHELVSPRSQYFIAGTKNGFIGITKILDEIEIASLAVHPNFQCKGIAQELLCHVLKIPGIKRFLLEVDEKNKTAIALYKKMGFISYYRREKYYKNGHAAIMMERVM